MTYQPSQGAQPQAGSDGDEGGPGPSLLRRAWLPAVVGVLVGMLAFLAVRGNEASYETCAYLRINSGPVDQAVLGLPAAAKPVPNLIVETSQEIAQDYVAERSIRYLRGNPFTDTEDLLDAIAVKPDPNSGLIGVCAKGATGREAQRIANATSRAYVDLNREEQQRNLRAARSQLERLNEARAARLRREPEVGADVVRESIDEGRQQIQRLTLAERINPESIVVTKPADLPLSPAGIPPWTLGFVGFILGAALTGAVMAVRSLSDRRVRSLHELERVTGAPVLAAVRRRRLLKRRRPLGTLRRRQAEPFRLLYARLCNTTATQDLRAIAFASVDDDGSSGGVTWYLAATAAAAGARALVVEADADRPSAVDDGDTRPAGMSDVVEGRATLDEVVFHIAADDRHAVDVLSPGERNGGRHLGGDAVRELLAGARAGYDHVLIDAPAVTDADAVPFVRQAEGVVLVHRQGGADRDTLREACHQLSVTGTPLLGVVAVGFLR